MNDVRFDLQRFANYIVGTEGDDYLNNARDNDTVNAGAGNDTVYNNHDYVLILAGVGNDSINNHSGYYSTINAGAGNDTVYNHNHSFRVSINGGTGNDYIINTGKEYESASYGYDINDVTILGGAGNDTISNDSYGYNSVIDGGLGADSISNGGDRVTITAGRGNDIVSLAADAYNNVLKYASGDGDDTVYGFGTDDTLDITDGALDNTSISGSDIIFKVGEGSVRLVKATGLTLTVRTKSGVTQKYYNAVNITTNDNLANNVDNMTINSGAGNDSITNSGARASLIAGAGADSVSNSGANSTILGGTGNDTITNSGASVKIDAGDGADSISNTGANATISAGAGNDSITNTSAPQSTINAGDGADYIRNYSDQSTLVGGAGNDIISNSGVNSRINAGAGDDSIYVDLRTTINAGTGNDTIYLGDNGMRMQYASGDGNDLVFNISEDDTLQLTGGATYYTVESGDDIVIKVGSGSVTFKEAVGMELNIVGTYSTVTTPSINYISNSTNNKLVVGTSGRDSIKNSGSGVSIQSNAGNDTIIGSSNAEMFLFSSADGNNLITNFGKNDSLRMTAGSSITYKKSGSDMIVTLKGTSYTGVETLKGAGSYNFKTSGNVLYVASSINTINNSRSNTLISGTSGNDSIKNSGSGVSIQANAGNDTIVGSSNAEMFLFSSADGNNLITNFGKNDSLRMTAGKTLTYKKSGSDMIVTLKGASYTGIETLKGAGSYNFKTSGNVLYVGSSINTINNSRSNTLISGTSGNDSIKNSGSKVSIQSGAGNDTLTGSSNAEMFLFSSADGNNLITNFGTNDSLRMTAGKTLTYKKSGSDMIVTLKGASYTGIETLKGAGDFNFKLNGNVLYVESEASGNVNYIVNSSDGVKLNGSSGRDYIFNTGERVTIQANGGNDTIEGSVDYGDQFWFSSADGNNVITNFDANDTLRMTAGNSLTFSTVDADVIVTLKGTSYTGTVKLLDAAGLNFKTSGSYLIAPNNRIDNSADSKKINGTAQADYITNSGERVTIEGKGGNDTIEGCDHGEMILFASDGGQDVVTNFGLNDTIRITAGSIQSISKLGSDRVVDVKGTKYSGSIVLGGAGDYNLVQNGSYLYVDAVNQIVNRTDNRKVTGTSGRDYITNSGAKVTIQSGAGNDTIESSNNGELFLFSSADGNNVIANFGKNDTIKVTAGSLASHYADGDDYVVSLKGTSYSGTVKLLDVANYTFVRSGNTLTVNPISIITRSNDRIKIVGTNDADSITSSGQYVTIQGNGGKDTITGSDSFGEMFLFSSADGNNLITNFGKNDSLMMTAGKSISYKKSGANMLVTLKGTSYTGVETLKGAGNYDFVLSGNVLSVKREVEPIINSTDGVKVAGTSSADYIVNSGENVTIQANAGNDTIEGSTFGEWFLFSSADGNNLITNFGRNDTLKVTSGNLATVRTVGADAVVSLKGTAYSGTVTLQGAGNYEFIRASNVLTVKNEVVPTVNSTDGVKFSGTSGNDFMINSGLNVTINAGAGDDTIEGANDGSELFQFGAADGNDVIYNFGTNDTLRITLGEITSYYASDADYVVEVARSNLYSGSVTLKNVGAINFSGNNVTATHVNAQLPTEVEDYWFEQNDQAVDEINSILAVENNHVDFDLDQIDRIKVSSIEIVEASARRQAKK